MAAPLHKNFDIEKRKPIWIALSDFYLYNELQDLDFKHIASKIKESPFTFEKVKQIDKEEIFPVLHFNLLDVAGVWSGFQEEWLVSEIAKKLQKRTWYSSFIIKIKYAKLKWMYSDSWEKLEAAYQKI